MPSKVRAGILGRKKVGAYLDKQAGDSMKKANGFIFYLIVIFLIFCLSSLVLISHAQERYISPEEAHKYIGEIQTVCGTVASTKYAIRSRGQPTFLNLNRPYPNHIFTIVIWGADRYKFKNPPEIFLKGKTICVTGLITTYRGKPQIIVQDPSQINIRLIPPLSPKSIGSTYHQRYNSEERIILKATLSLLGYELNSETDKWDEKTDEAVRAFQWANKLTPDGKIGPRTLRAMANSVNKLTKLRWEDRAKIRDFLLNLALRHESILPRTRQQNRSIPFRRRDRHYNSRRVIKIGEEVEFYDYETGGYKYGQVESISDGEVEVYDYEKGEYYYIDIDNIE